MEKIIIKRNSQQMESPLFRLFLNIAVPSNVPEGSQPMPPLVLVHINFNRPKSTNGESDGLATPTAADEEEANPRVLRTI